MSDRGSNAIAVAIVATIFTVVLGVGIWWEVYAFKDCKRVGHNTGYCTGCCKCGGTGRKRGGEDMISLNCPQCSQPLPCYRHDAPPADPPAPRCEHCGGYGIRECVENMRLLNATTHTIPWPTESPVASEGLIERVHANVCDCLGENAGERCLSLRAEVRAAIKDAARLPDSINEALNSGDGVYRP